jgi:hypothetical protein
MGLAVGESEETQKRLIKEAKLIGRGDAIARKKQIASTEIEKNHPYLPCML